MMDRKRKRPSDPHKQHVWTLYVSELAALLGKHRFQTVPQAMIQVWKRTFPTEWDTACRELGLTTPDAKLKEEDQSAAATLQHTYQQVKQQVRDIPANQVSAILASLPTTQLQEQPIDTIVSNIQSGAWKVPGKTDGPTTSEEKRLIQHKQSVMYTQSGRTQESSILNRYEQTAQTNVGFRNAIRYRWTHPSGRFCLVGRVDGIDLKTQTIVEAKERQSRLFGRVPEYERVALQWYMFLTGMKSATLIESFRNQQRSYVVFYRPDEIEQWLDHLYHDLIPILDNRWSMDDLYAVTVPSKEYNRIWNHIFPDSSPSQRLIRKCIDSYLFGST